jgi:sigma-B regulation protein RsbU (phosphoserine phosphatase)
MTGTTPRPERDLPTVLIVDDDLDYRAVVGVVLQAGGYRVVTAEDGIQGWGMILREDPEVVLVDWNMPGADGINLLKRLRSDPEQRDRYAIMVTARSETSDIVAGMEAGADDYLTKPFENDELIARVSVGMRTRLLQRELAEHTRLSAVLEMAGSVAHEIGNPLTTARLLFQSLVADPRITGDPELHMEIEELGQQLDRIEILVRKAQSLTSVRSKPYAEKLSIIDIKGSSGTPSSS